MYEYRVTKFENLNNIIIPFFKKYPILGIKQLDFLDFCEIANLIQTKKHLTKEGLEKILELKKGITLRKNNNVTNNHNIDQGPDNQI